MLSAISVLRCSHINTSRALNRSQALITSRGSDLSVLLDAGGFCSRINRNSSHNSLFLGLFLLNWIPVGVWVCILNILIINWLIRTWSKRADSLYLYGVGGVLSKDMKMCRWILLSWLHRNITVAVFGLDNSGKSSSIKVLKGGTLPIFHSSLDKYKNYITPNSNWNNSNNALMLHFLLTGWTFFLVLFVYHAQIWQTIEWNTWLL